MKPLRVGVGGFGAESNAFSLERPGNEFAEVVIDGELISTSRGKRNVVGGFLDSLAKADAEAVPTLKVWWGATGIVARQSYERFKEQMLGMIEEAGELDGLLLDLHGAMMSENQPDAEGVLLREIREMVGKRVPVVCVLDLHANMTDLKVASADAILGYRTNPHIDMYERGVKAGQLLLQIIEHRYRPVMYLKRLPLLGNNLAMSTWAYDSKTEIRLPMVRIMRRAEELEKEEDVLDVSVFIGFGHSDIAECVTSVLAVAETNRGKAQSVAESIAGMVWDARRDFLSVRPLTPVDEAIEKAMESASGPVILVDVSDNAGGGGPCDNTVILEALLRKGAEDAVVPLRDYEAVSEAHRAGVGATLEIEVGGKIDRRFCSPVKMRTTVKTLSDGRYTIRGPSHGGYSRREGSKDVWKQADVGRMALLKTGGVEVIVSEGRVGMERDYYKAAGVDPSERKIVVVKSHQAHRASFEPIAKQIIEVDTPGITSPIYRGLNFTHVPRPVFPLDSI